MWSGSAISAQWYLPEGTGTEALGFWFPEDGAGTIGNDNIAIPRNAKNPVLAHHFLNYLLDNKHGYDNFSNYVGYQPPFTRLDPDRLIAGRHRAREPEDRDRARVGFRQGLLPDRADSGRPDGMAERLGRVQGGCLTPTACVGEERRSDGFWAGLALPGVGWLALFFLLPFYVILCVAFGTVDPIFQTPSPEWNPLAWNTAAFEFVFEGLFTSGAAFQTVFVRTLAYVAIATTLALLIAYPVAYYVARYGGRWKGLLLVGLIAPFFISYLMRMLAWINLLQDDGWVNDVLVWVGILDVPRNWLDGRASSVILGLVYGYVPFMILPLYAFLDRIDKSLLEAARDLGASPFQAFRMVTLPLSMPAILAGIVIIALPMFGDYYTPDLLSQSPSTSMIGNQIVLYIQGGQQIPVGAALVVVLMLFLSVLMGYYLYATARAQRRLGR